MDDFTGVWFRKWGMPLSNKMYPNLAGVSQNYLHDLALIQRIQKNRNYFPPLTHPQQAVAMFSFTYE